MSWRQIHSSVPASSTLAELSDAAERLYWRLLACSDAWGRLRGETTKVRVTCAPLLDWDDDDVDGYLDELLAAGRIVAYEVDHRRFIALLDFDEWQPENARKRGTAQMPEPDQGTPVEAFSAQPSGARQGALGRGAPEKGALGRARARQGAKRKSREEKRRVEKKITSPSLSPRYAAAYETLRGIEKSGYGESKFTLERFAELVAQHPTVDILVEAERLRDWEIYGVGENQQTRDGILRLRNWLTKAEEHRQPEVVTGYDDSLPLGGLRHLTPADRGLEWSEEHGEWRNPWEM